MLNRIRMVVAVAASTLAASASAQEAPGSQVALPAARQLEVLEAQARQQIAVAEAAEIQARISNLPSSGVSGDLEIKDGAGQAEALVLAARHLLQTASLIVENVPAAPPERPGVQPRHAGEPDPVVYVSGVGGFPDLTALHLFNRRVSATERQLTGAATTAREIVSLRNRSSQQSRGGGRNLKGGGGLEFVPVAASILSYFRSDFTAQGVSVSGLDQDALVAATLAAGAARKFRLLENTAVSAAAADELFSRLDAIDHARTELEPARQICVRWRAEVSGASNETRAAVEARLAEALDKCATLDLALTAYQALGVDLGAENGKALVQVLKQMSMRRRVQRNDRLLLVDLHGLSGGAFTQENFFSSLGAMPFHVTTAAVVSWRLLDADGEVQAAGWLPVYSGYQRLQEVDRLINACASVEDRRRQARNQPPREGCPGA